MVIVELLTQRVVRTIQCLGFSVDSGLTEGSFILTPDSDKLLGEDYCDTPYAIFYKAADGIHFSSIGDSFTKYKVEDAPIWFTDNKSLKAYLVEVVKILKTHPDFKNNALKCK